MREFTLLPSHFADVDESGIKGKLEIRGGRGWFHVSAVKPFTVNGVECYGSAGFNLQGGRFVLRDSLSWGRSDYSGNISDAARRKLGAFLDKFINAWTLAHQAEGVADALIDVSNDIVRVEGKIEEKERELAELRAEKVKLEYEEAGIRCWGKLKKADVATLAGAAAVSDDELSA